VPNFTVNDRVMLDWKNIRIKWQCKKLEGKLYGPFKITKVRGNKQWCRLELPSTWKIHHTFNVALLEQY
jgi:hypothetical protein